MNRHRQHKLQPAVQQAQAWAAKLTVQVLTWVLQAARQVLQETTWLMQTTKW